MLHEFLTMYREQLIARAGQKVAARLSPDDAEADIDHGVPLFLDQLADTLRRELATTTRVTSVEMEEQAALHGAELRRAGFTLGQVVHGYGDVCQAVTELALEIEAPISVDEFKTLNRSLDDAIARAVTEFARARDVAVADRGTERFGFFAHELRNLLGNAILAFEVLQDGRVGVGGGTGAILKRSLYGLRDLIDRSLAEVRAEAGLLQREQVLLTRFSEEIGVAATLDANARGVRLTVVPPEPGWAIDANPQQITAALANLLQNALKFTRPGGSIELRMDTGTSPGHVLIEVQDECGGLPEGKAEDLFRPFEQRGDDKTGLGLGLTIAREGVAVNGGEIRARSLPGIGCVFTIDMPVQLSAPPATGARETLIVSD